jgi:hypothetical protein
VAKDNKDMARREEPTKAPTPDKLDRSLREKWRAKPYPLTEEEATPNTPATERADLDATSSPKTTDDLPGRKKRKVRREIKKRTAEDYNKFVSHPAKR